MPSKPNQAVSNKSITPQMRVGIAVVAFIVLSVMLTTLRHFAGTLHLVRQHSVDEIERYERRFGPLKNVLPRRAVLGFVTDAKNLTEVENRQRMVSYVLSPIVVDAAGEWPLMVGDFANSAAAKQSIGTELRVRQDFGDGVLLLERIE
jgi:hypothetical protein